jgi:hypothetical protein
MLLRGSSRVSPPRCGVTSCHSWGGRGGCHRTQRSIALWHLRAVRADRVCCGCDAAARVGAHSARPVARLRKPRRVLLLAALRCCQCSCASPARTHAFILCKRKDFFTTVLHPKTKRLKQKIQEKNVPISRWNVECMLLLHRSSQCLNWRDEMESRGVCLAQEEEIAKRVYSIDIGRVMSSRKATLHVTSPRSTASIAKIMGASTPRSRAMRAAAGVVSIPSATWWWRARFMRFAHTSRSKG